MVNCLRFNNHTPSLRKIRSQKETITRVNLYPKTSINSDNLNISTYYFLRQDRVSRGGVIAVYNKKELKYKVLLQESLKFIEHICIELSWWNEKLILANIYRTRNSVFNAFVSNFEDILFAFFAICDNILHLGDYNFNMYDSTLV